MANSLNVRRKLQPAFGMGACTEVVADIERCEESGRSLKGPFSSTRAVERKTKKDLIEIVIGGRIL